MLETFQLSKPLVQRMLSLAMSKGGDFADIFCEYSRYNSLFLEEGIIKRASSTVEKGIGIRVVKGEKTGYAYSELFDEASLLQTAQTAAAIADDRGSDQAFAVKSKRIPNYYRVEDLATDTDLETKIALINLAETWALAASPEISKVNISLADSDRSLLMIDSRGQMVQDNQPMIRFSITVMAERDGDKQQGRSGGGGRQGFSKLDETRVKNWAEAAAREALLLLEAEEAPAGMLPVILGPGESGILLHEAIGHPLEADFNRKGSSAYTGRIGEQVADPQCTIIDDGTLLGDRGSINIDDELNNSQRTVLIENGILRSYMCDEMSARFFDMSSTGNGRRESYRYQPLPRMRSTYMLGGTYDPDEVIASTSKGVYCKTFRGGQVDISNGNFIFVPSEAYLIENGKVSHPVKNFTLIGNGPDVLSKVTMIASDFRMSEGVWTCGKGQQVPVGVGLPTIKISEMTVGGQSA